MADCVRYSLSQNGKATGFTVFVAECSDDQCGFFIMFSVIIYCTQL